MNDFNIILKYLKKIGYPNKNLITLFKSLDYDTDNFLPDLIENLGKEGANLFIQKTIDKLNTPEGIRIDLEEHGYPESYIYLKIKQFTLDLDEAEDSILITYSWGDGMLMHPEENKLYTKKEVYNSVDMQEWGDLLDTFESAGSSFFFYNCGYYLWYE